MAQGPWSLDHSKLKSWNQSSNPSCGKREESEVKFCHVWWKATNLIRICVKWAHGWNHSTLIMLRLKPCSHLFSVDFSKCDWNHGTWNNCIDLIENCLRIFCIYSVMLVCAIISAVINKMLYQQSVADTTWPSILTCWQETIIAC